MQHLVTSYPNPDLDGVASAIVRAWMLKEEEGIVAHAVFAGKLDNETSFVLSALRIDQPRCVKACPTDHHVHLVDTHHLVQIAGHVAPQQVLTVFDHHPGGNADKFPNATIVNEVVGAAATLIEERIRNQGLSLPGNLAQLLHAAIISNTLNFTAPTTTTRDRDAAERLETVEPLPEGFTNNMLSARSGVDNRTTPELLAMDYKEFDLGSMVVGISQLELGAANAVLDRPDLESSLRKFEETCIQAAFVFLSVVDIGRRETTVVAVSDVARTAVSCALGREFAGTRLLTRKILLRKSDFIPQLRSLVKDGMPSEWIERG